MEITQYPAADAKAGRAKERRARGTGTQRGWEGGRGGATTYQDMAI